MPQSREIRKFSLFFETDQIVELEITTDHPDEIRKDRFLDIELLNGTSRVAHSQFNLANLPLVKISARPTGYGKAEIIMNDRAGDLAPVRNSRVRLFGKLSISSIERDLESKELILIPDPTNFRGLITIIDRDGGRRTLTLVMTTAVEAAAD